MKVFGSRNVLEGTSLRVYLVVFLLSVFIEISTGYYPGVGLYDNLDERELRGVKAANGRHKLKWVHARAGQYPPKGAFVVGYSGYKRPIYLGRVNHAGNQLPAKVYPDMGVAYTQWNGQVIQVDYYEALCYGNLAWIPFAREIPKNALVLGQLANGENVYVGRGWYINTLEPGIVLEDEKVLYIPNGDSSRRITNFELLIDLDQKEECPQSPITCRF